MREMVRGWWVPLMGLALGLWLGADSPEAGIGVASFATAVWLLRPPWLPARYRAERLLWAHLDRGQLRSWLLFRTIRVRARSGRVYRVREMPRSWNVTVVDGDHIGSEFCAGLPRSLPMQDNVLALKFMLESCEHEFLRIANRHTYGC